MENNKYINDRFVKTNNAMLKSRKLKKIKSIMYYVDRNLNIYVRKPKKQDNNKKRVLIVFNLALGDGVVFLCAIKNIRKLYPEKDYILDIACQKGLESIYTNIGIFDTIIPLEFTKGTVSVKERYNIIKRLNNNYYDLVLDPVGANECSTNVLMTRNAKAEKKIGAIMEMLPRSCSKHIIKKTYNEIKKIKSKSLIEQYYEFFYDKYNVEFIDLPCEKVNLDIPEKYYVLFPSASTELKRWPMDRYVEIVRRIYKKTKLPLLICGTNSDKKSYDELRELIKYDNIPIIDVLGKTNLLSFFEIIKKAQFVITNDTSTYHIAVISQTPVAIIAGGYVYDKYILYDFKGKEKYKRPYVIVNKMKCFNCYNECSTVNEGHGVWPCLYKISVDYAWKIIEKMIEKEVN